MATELSLSIARDQVLVCLRSAAFYTEKIFLKIVPSKKGSRQLTSKSYQDLFRNKVNTKIIDKLKASTSFSWNIMVPKDRNPSQ